MKIQQYSSLKGDKASELSCSKIFRALRRRKVYGIWFMHSDWLNLPDQSHFGCGTAKNVSQHHFVDAGDAFRHEFHNLKVIDHFRFHRRCSDQSEMCFFLWFDGICTGLGHIDTNSFGSHSSTPQLKGLSFSVLTPKQTDWEKLSKDTLIHFTRTMLSPRIMCLYTNRLVS